MFAVKFHSLGRHEEERTEGKQVDEGEGRDRDRDDDDGKVDKFNFPVTLL